MGTLRAIIRQAGLSVDEFRTISCELMLCSRMPENRRMPARSRHAVRQDRLALADEGQQRLVDPRVDGGGT